MRNDLAQEIRQRVSLQSVLERYGYRPDRSGFLCCPFHAGDRDASLKVYKDNTWHCFGCHKYGSVIDWVMEMERVSFMEAVRIIDRDFGLGLLERGPDLRHKRLWEERKKQTQLLEEYRRQARLWLIERRRELWWEFMRLAVTDHDSAKQRAFIIAEVERLDYLLGGGDSH